MLLIHFPIRDLVGAPFKSFKVNCKTISFPMQQLNLSPLAIEKNEYVSSQRVSSQFIADNSAQAVKPLAQICMFPVQIIPVGSIQGQHY